MKPGYLARLLMLFFLTACTADETPERAHVGHHIVAVAFLNRRGN
jgi:hypothetical protein